MPRKKKHPLELTTEELAKKLFPKKVVDQVKREVAPASIRSITGQSK